MPTWLLADNNNKTMINKKKGIWNHAKNTFLLHFCTWNWKHDYKWVTCDMRDYIRVTSSKHVIKFKTRDQIRHCTDKTQTVFFSRGEKTKSYSYSMSSIRLKEITLRFTVWDKDLHALQTSEFRESVLT